MFHAELIARISKLLGRNVQCERIEPTVRELVEKLEAATAARQVLAEEVFAHRLVPVDPPPGLLVSMAMRLHHDFGVDARAMGVIKTGWTDAERAALLGDMRKLYEEVVGLGFYHPDREEAYLAIHPKGADDAAG